MYNIKHIKLFNKVNMCKFKYTQIYKKNKGLFYISLKLILNNVTNSISAK
jgi:hypothetical protein